jgi:hypothetical protein
MMTIVTLLNGQKVSKPRVNQLESDIIIIKDKSQKQRTIPGATADTVLRTSLNPMAEFWVFSHTSWINLLLTFFIPSKI